MTSEQNLQKLKPFVVRKIWGGKKLSQLKNFELLDGEEPVGESLEVSRLEESSSASSLGELKDLYTSDELPYLIKFIDTSDNLSVQVHPHDEYARVHESGPGKTECWLILASDPGCGVYLGLKKGVDKATFMNSLEKGDDLSRSLKFYETKAGDFFYVPAGAVHAIGKGVTLVEIQQSSGSTYRIWDWNRVDSKGKSRELHIDKAMDVSRFDEVFNQEDNFLHQTGCFEKTGTHLIVEHPNFCVFLVNKIYEKEKIGKLRGRQVSIVSLGDKVTVDACELEAYTSGLMKTLPHMLESKKAVLLVL